MERETKKNRRNGSAVGLAPLGTPMNIDFPSRLDRRPTGEFTQSRCFGVDGWRGWIYLCDTTVDKANSQLNLKAGRNSRGTTPRCCPALFDFDQQIGFSLAPFRLSWPRPAPPIFPLFLGFLRDSREAKRSLEDFYAGIARKFRGSNYVLTLSTAAGWKPVLPLRLPFVPFRESDERRSVQFVQEEKRGRDRFDFEPISNERNSRLLKLVKFESFSWKRNLGPRREEALKTFAHVRFDLLLRIPLLERDPVIRRFSSGTSRRWRFNGSVIFDRLNHHDPPVHIFYYHLLYPPLRPSSHPMETRPRNWRRIGLSDIYFVHSVLLRDLSLSPAPHRTL